MLQEIPGHSLLSRVQRLCAEQEEESGNSAAEAPPAQVWGHSLDQGCAWALEAPQVLRCPLCFGQCAQPELSELKPL